MENLTETVDLDIDESNDLAFRIRLEGTSTAPAKVRLVCEGKDFSYMFNGYGTGEPEVVQFTLPQMSSKMQEGIYDARVEVLVENRYFSPLQFQINFKKMVSVVAESMKVIQKPQRQEIKVTASPIIPQKSVSSSSPIIKFEQKPVTEAIQQKQNTSSNFKKNSSLSTKTNSLKENFKKSYEKTNDDLDDETLHQIARTILNGKNAR